MEKNTRSFIEEIKNRYRGEYLRKAAGETRATTVIGHVAAGTGMTALVIGIGLPAFGVALSAGAAVLTAVAVAGSFYTLKVLEGIRKNNAVRSADRQMDADIESGALLGRFRDEVLSREAAALRDRFRLLKSLRADFAGKSAAPDASKIPASIAPPARIEP